jgi:hypothetical protein
MPTVTVSSTTYKYKTVQALSFNTAETKVAAVINEGNADGPLAFVLMDVATGASSIKMVAPTTSIYVSYPKSIVLDNSDNIFATLKHGPDFSAMMLSLTSGSSTKTTSWGYVNDPNIKVSQAFAVVADSSGFYTSALIETVGLVFIHISTTGVMNWEIGPFGLSSAGDQILYMSISGG